MVNALMVEVGHASVHDAGVFGYGRFDGVGRACIRRRVLRPIPSSSMKAPG